MKKESAFQRFWAAPLVEGGKVPRSESFWHALGVAGQNMSCGLIGSWFFIYCTDILYIDSLVLGFVLGFVRVWDTINDPMIGTLIDRHRFRNGDKLRPYLKFTPFFVGVVGALMFINPGITGQAGKVVYVLFMYLTYDVFFTMQDVSMWGMTAVMSPLSKERGKVSQIAHIGGTIGSWLPGLFSIILANAHFVGLSDRAVYGICGVLFCFGGMMLSITTSKAVERVHPVNYLDKPKSTLKDGLNILMKNRTVLLILLGSALSGLALVVPTAYFFKYKVSVNLFGTTIEGLNIMFLYGILAGLPGTLAMLFVPAFAKRVGGMRNVMILGCACESVFRVLAFFVGYQDWRIFLVMLIVGVGGIPAGMRSIAITTLWGDAIDYMEWKTDMRGEAVVFSAQVFASKISGALATIVSGVLLTLMDYSAEAYDAGLPLSDTFDKWIWPLFILGPVIGSVLYLIPILFVKYPEELKERVERELRERRGDGVGPEFEYEVLFEEIPEESLR